MPYSVRVDVPQWQARRGSLAVTAAAHVADAERSCACGGVHAGPGGDSFGSGREGIGAGELEPCVATEDDQTEHGIEQLRHGARA